MAKQELTAENIDELVAQVDTGALQQIDGRLRERHHIDAGPRKGIDAQHAGAAAIADQHRP